MGEIKDVLEKYKVDEVHELSGKVLDEDSAGLIHFIKSYKLKDSEGKVWNIPKGARLRHKRTGNSDYLIGSLNNKRVEILTDDDIPRDVIEVI